MRIYADIYIHMGRRMLYQAISDIGDIDGHARLMCIYLAYYLYCAISSLMALNPLYRA